MTNVGKEVASAISKAGRGKYTRTKSEKGGIQDQMNCVYAFMEGYMKESDESEATTSLDDGKICITDFETRKKAQVYQYRTGKTQWQIGAIELHAKMWHLSLVEIFTLGEFLYCYCPSFSGSPTDWTRLKNFGKRVQELGLNPMKAMDIAKLQHIQEKAEELRKMAAEIGVEIQIKL